MKHRTALIAIAKNEQPYIQEWVDYHKKIGFDHIYIYENDSRHTITGDRVTLIPWDGHPMQEKAYVDAVSRFSNMYDFLAIWDIDEFLVLKKHNNVSDFLHDYRDLLALGLVCFYYGNNNHTAVKDDNYSCIKRFTKRHSDIASMDVVALKYGLPKNRYRHVKCIYKVPNKDLNPSGAHRANIKTYNTNRELLHPSGKVLCDLSKKPPFDVAYLNHYFSKTPEEFKNKISRGRANSPVGKLRKLNEYRNGNFNAVEDLTAYNFMYGDK